MATRTYTVRRRHHDGTKFYETGDKITVAEDQVERLASKGVIETSTAKAKPE